MNPKKVTPQDLKAEAAQPIKTNDLELSTCPTCLSGIEASTLENEYLEILKR